ncbi:hypothetical protein GH714_014785 [Hevea brasiliensis]|uniref:Uncharacterized protein n=1 Tax=Hevea brasiliensis TaxID=3981 RepID=A0A6A6K8I3_HEVBR|nr:hypothetical protein GH714_014785 [Hevea brasiliensis]
MARVKQVATKPQKFMGDAMKAAGRPKKEREDDTKIDDNKEEIETVVELMKKRKGKGIAGSEPSKKKRKLRRPLFQNPLCSRTSLNQGIMAKQNAKMEMLINSMDRQKWFMKEITQRLFSESFEKFGDFGNYPHGTAGITHAKEASSSRVKISKIEEEEEENVETVEKGKEVSKLKL